MNYCTLFNIYYLSRGLALYHSLCAHASNFHLFIFAFDDVVFEILEKMQLRYATIISLNEFETRELLQVKSQRTVGEYCWTCTPSVILHCLEKYDLSQVCYIDADCYFWNDPNTLLMQTEPFSTLLTEHRYTRQYDKSNISGKYCVQFMAFKKDSEGLKALHWWKNACIEWCYNRVEKGKFGDQKYLDDWLERFTGVKVIEHLGAGVAPWNVQQYEVVEQAANEPVHLKMHGKIIELFFYHFHGLKFVNNNIELGGYRLSSEIIQKIYRPYIHQLLREELALHSIPQLKNIMQHANVHGKISKRKSLFDKLREYKQKWWGINNTYFLNLDYSHSTAVQHKNTSNKIF